MSVINASLSLYLDIIDAQNWSVMSINEAVAMALSSSRSPQWSASSSRGREGGGDGGVEDAGAVLSRSV